MEGEQLKILNTLLEIAGLAVVGVGLALGAGEGKTLGGMVGILVGFAVFVEGAWLFDSE